MDWIMDRDAFITKIDNVYFVVADVRIGGTRIPVGGTPVHAIDEINQWAMEHGGVYVVHYSLERAWYVDGNGIWNGEIMRHQLSHDNEDEKIIIKLFEGKTTCNACGTQCDNLRVFGFPLVHNSFEDYCFYDGMKGTKRICKQCEDKYSHESWVKGKYRK